MLGAVLKGAAAACVGAGLCHAVLGVSGDWIVGIAPASPIDPSLDSQNRFYGTAFLLYGAVLWLSAGDIRRFAPLIKAALAIMFLAGCARALAVLEHGWPSQQIMFLWGTEILLPPPLWLWLKKEIN